MIRIEGVNANERSAAVVAWSSGDADERCVGWVTCMIP